MFYTQFPSFYIQDLAGAGGVSFFQVLPTYHNPSGKKAYIMNMYTSGFHQISDMQYVYHCKGLFGNNDKTVPEPHSDQYRQTVDSLLLELLFLSQLKIYIFYRCFFINQIHVFPSNQKLGTKELLKN